MLHQRLHKMTSLISRVTAFAGRHWLRLLIVGGALFLLSDKQINFNVRLGGPKPPTELAPQEESVAPVVPVDNPQRPVLTDAEPVAVSKAATSEEKASFFDRFKLFGSSEPSAFELLTRQEEQVVAAFLRRFSNVAQAEQEKYGIPASLTLANALLHGRAGQADAAKDYHNYFGLDCGDDWPGATGRSAGQCYRAYENAWTSFRDHSLHITSGKFAAMTQFGNTDYRRWAAGLEELGFNDTSDLAEQLVRTVDRYQLFRFD